jgi:hypothetical protein
MNKKEQGGGHSNDMSCAAERCPGAEACGGWNADSVGYMLILMNDDTMIR